ncbi:MULTISPECIES: alpha/beta fold hydrolase [Tsukamurella]|uniref:Alpha/beta fold hydrolase n=2 Tax=Tsukamurella TaxID=2060 RepID=A0A5C5S2M1_9ACTN|nr:MULTISPECIES: alpha/beta fold hydrolase [Tsukamurella]NMD56495.1 alpha/beta fold hydrolase [Tsukamurella columbiensis]TWS29162.1 alpha/beta fold hydrolase [Tsukamurella conjunctivitidis]
MAEQVLDTRHGPVGATVAGDGPTVLLLHGFLFSRAMWAPQLNALADSGFRGVAIDLLGFGDTAPVASGGEIALHHHAEAAIDVLDLLGAERFAGVGYSMGGQVALELADLAGPRLERLLLSDTFAGLDTPEVRTARLSLADRLETEGTARYGEEFLPAVLGPTTVATRPAVCAQARAMIAAAPPAGAAAALRGRAARRDLSAAAGAFGGDARVVVGAEDVFDGGTLGAGLAAALGTVDLHVLPGTGHSPSLETPELFDPLLGNFLRAAR